MSSNASSHAGVNASAAVRERRPSPLCHALLPMPARQRCYFERLFFMLDEEGSGVVSTEKVDRFLSFVAFELDETQRSRLIIACQRLDIRSIGVLNEMSLQTRQSMTKLTRRQFVQLCMGVLWDKETEMLTEAAATFELAQSLSVRRAGHYWRQVAHRIDIRCRMLLPPLYFCALVVVCCLEFHDDERGQSVTLSGAQLLVAIFTPLTLLFAACFCVVMRARAKSAVLERRTTSLAAGVRIQRQTRLDPQDVSRLVVQTPHARSPWPRPRRARTTRTRAYGDSVGEHRVSDATLNT